MTRAWGRALVTALLYLLAVWSLSGGTGLSRRIVANTPERGELDSRQVPTINLDSVDAAMAGPVGITITWRGAWEVPATGLYDLALSSRGRSTWMIDGQPAQASAPEDQPPAARTVWLESGFHEFEITYAPDQAAPAISVTAARSGQPQAPLDPKTLKPRPPRNPHLRAAGIVVRALLGWLTIAAIIWAVRVTIAAVRDRWRGPIWRPWLGRAAAWIALAVLLIHGAVLRLDAITARYGPVREPAWIAALQTRTTLPPQSIRSNWMIWELEPLYPHQDGVATRYRSDPYTYLTAARQMTSFYAAHYREPVFPFATKIALRLMDDQDVAVSFASAAFSILAIWLTYLLGAALWSRPVGLLAALGLSVNYDVISLASLGWRDDAYVAAIVLCAYLMVRLWRAIHAAPRAVRVGRWQVDRVYVEAAGLGAASGLAVLTRIMAVPFLAAGAVCVLAALSVPWRRRLSVVGFTLLVALVVAGPYFVNCWRVYGDPLYTFNVHGGIYSVAEGKEEWKDSTASYVGEKIAERPFKMLDTVAQGLTTYPFGNKWSGLGRWGSGIGEWAAIVSFVGLVLLAGLAPGRLLLVSMVASLVPFAFTWKVDANFRFTEHAYPILLIAAAVAIGVAGRLARALVVKSRSPQLPFSSWRAWVSVVGIGLLGVWFVDRVSPSWVFAETITAREDATITVGPRDRAFFNGEWSNAFQSGNVRTRVMLSEGAIALRLPAVADYPITLRLDPFPSPLGAEPVRLPAIDVRLNDAPIGVIQLQWTPDRVGSYDLMLPSAAVRRGVNELRFVVRRSAASNPVAIRPGLSDGGAVGLWYLRIHPPPAREGGRN